MKPDRISWIADHYDTLMENGCTDYRQLLILSRFIIRDSLECLNKVDDDLRYFNRQKAKLERQDMKVPLLDAQIDYLKGRWKTICKALASIGKHVVLLLDEWQETGATLEDLCDLIGRPVRLITAQINDVGEPVKQLSEVMAIYGLDYQSNGSGFYEYTQDGPFTHATKEFLIDQMLHTETGQKAAHEAFVNVFPELWDKRMYEAADSEGNRVLVDKDGKIVGSLK